MTRIAGDNPGYTFRLCRVTSTPSKNAKGILAGGRELSYAMTDMGFDLPSVTTVIKETLGPPAGAMSWWGFRIATKEIARMISTGDRLEDLLVAETGEAVDDLLKERGANPNLSRDAAGDRGNFAHDVLEFCIGGHIDWATDLADYEERYQHTLYSHAVIKWWNEVAVKRYSQVVSECQVWSLRDRYAGSLDAAGELLDGGWEVVDLKTHKPAAGFTKPGKGPAYLSDVIQVRAYRKAWEEMGLGETVSQRILIARENGKYLEDKREAPYGLFLAIRQAYDDIKRFEGSEV